MSERERLSNTGKHCFQAGPSPIARKALALHAQYRELTGSTITPIHIQDENWDIAFNPTERVLLLSRKGNSRGISIERPRTPSWLNKA